MATLAYKAPRGCRAPLRQYVCDLQGADSGDGVTAGTPEQNRG